METMSHPSKEEMITLTATKRVASRVEVIHNNSTLDEILKVVQD